MAGVELSIEQDRLERLALIIETEADGKRLKRDFGLGLRAAVEPALPLIRSELMSMPSAGLSASPPLRTTVLSKMKVATRLSGASPGVRVAIGRTPELRRFESAARRLNRAEGWSHPVYGRAGTSVHQVGVADYFDRPLQDRAGELRDAVRDALDKMAARIAGA